MQHLRLAVAATIAATCASLCNAQTVIISNVFSTNPISNGLRIGSGSVFDSASFQFQMGNDSYLLQEVEIRGSFTLCSGNTTPLLTIREDDSDALGLIVASLTPAGALGGPGYYTFSAPADVVLQANTIYWLDGRPMPGGSCFGWGGTGPPDMPTGLATGMRYMVNESGAPPNQSTLRLELRGTTAGPFSNYCAPVNPNSTGVPASISGLGSATLAQNDMAVQVVDLPLNSFGLIIVSRAQGFVANPGGSAGNLCLSNAIGRYVGPGQIQNSGATGMTTLPIDWMQIPQPTGFVPAAVGDTWNFQAWYRDAVFGFPVSNFSNGLSVIVQ